MDKVIDTKKDFFISALRGAIVALCVAMVLILIFAFVVKYVGLSESAINPVNQIIKILSIFFGVLSACKHSCQKCFVKGITVGLIFEILSFVLFSLLNNFSFVFDMSVVWNVVFSSIIGGVCAIAVYYLKK